MKFKNTSIIEIQNDDGRLNSDEYEKTSKFLRKITDERTGLNVYRQDSKYVMVVGGIKVPTLSGTAYSEFNYTYVEQP